MPLYGTVVLSTSKINSIFGGLTHCGTRLEQIIDNRSTGKGLETCNFFAISHSGACYGHVV